MFQGTLVFMLIGVVVVVGGKEGPGLKKSSKSLCTSTYTGTDNEIMSLGVNRTDLERMISKYWQKKTGDLRGVFEV